MDQRLYKATIEGKVESLHNLIKEDPLILHRNNYITTINFLETPLHISSILGHEKLADELLKLRPELAQELDSQRSTPLHLASAKGHVGIVKSLLRIDSDMCFASDFDGRNPVHIAALRGKIDALKELMNVKPEAAREIVCKHGQTILHLCVAHGQFQALKLLLEDWSFKDMINSKDKNGDTILHLAVTNKQTEITDYLLALTSMEVNALNLKGMSAMDILIKRGRDFRDLEIEESLNRAGAFGARPNTTKEINLLQYPDRESSPKNKQNKRRKKSLNQDDWLDKKRSALMVVASLIATMAFQVGVQPPAGVWDDKNTNDSQGNSVFNPNEVRHNINIFYTYLKRHAQFYMINTISFIASLSIILLLMSGLPLKSRFFMWILMVITWVAITAIALSYTISVILLTPSKDENSIGILIGITVFVWLCLMALLLIGHTIRLFVKIVKQFVKMVRKVTKPFTKRKRVHVNNGRVLV
ncbi:hypothetical protein ACJIZ3_007755 [Penstemon smallii]|uniref:PGG domain-containing protein n=1 Tax=Penstemon smallii TaxID=265156 RepID=A0ABD3T7W0_9LAMI